MMPFRYLVSGGVSMRGLMPEITHGAWERLEAALSAWMGGLGMFALFSLKRK
jgi:hypothetical protein